jgi:hypothetical protein
MSLKALLAQQRVDMEQRAAATAAYKLATVDGKPWDGHWGLTLTAGPEHPAAASASGFLAQPPEIVSAPMPPSASSVAAAVAVPVARGIDADTAAAAAPTKKHALANYEAASIYLRQVTVVKKIDASRSANRAGASDATALAVLENDQLVEALAVEDDGVGRAAHGLLLPYEAPVVSRIPSAASLATLENEPHKHSRHARATAARAVRYGGAAAVDAPPAAVVLREQWLVGSWFDGEARYRLQGKLCESLKAVEGATLHDDVTGAFLTPVSLRLGAGGGAVRVCFDWKMVAGVGGGVARPDDAVLCRVAPRLFVVEASLAANDDAGSADRFTTDAATSCRLVNAIVARRPGVFAHAPVATNDAAFAARTYPYPQHVGTAEAANGLEGQSSPLTTAPPPRRVPELERLTSTAFAQDVIAADDQLLLHTEPVGDAFTALRHTAVTNAAKDTGRILLLPAVTDGDAAKLAASGFHLTVIRIQLEQRRSETLAAEQIADRRRRFMSGDAQQQDRLWRETVGVRALDGSDDAAARVLDESTSGAELAVPRGGAAAAVTAVAAAFASEDDAVSAVVEEVLRRTNEACS